MCCRHPCLCIALQVDELRGEVSSVQTFLTQKAQMEEELAASRKRSNQLVADLEKQDQEWEKKYCRGGTY